jgi:glycosyltransferase involved in cell wall biosynthesis
MVKLLYITNGVDGTGGLERVLSVKTKYLSEELDYEVHILVLNAKKENSFYDFGNNIQIHNVEVQGNPFQYFYGYIKGIKRCIAEIKPNVISVCDDGLKGFILPIFFKKKAKIIYERHASIKLNFIGKKENFLNRILQFFTIYFMRFFSIFFDKFIVLTEGNLSEWKSNNLMVIPNSLIFYPDRRALLENKKVIAVGNHNYNKGYDLLLKIWAELSKKYPEWILEIYGNYNENKTYQHLANELNISDSVVFHKPVIDIMCKYLDASIMVLPSRSEGFGMVLIEAMSCGLPCVSFDCPSGPRDIITNNEDGYLIENGNSELFSEKLKNLIESKSLRIQFGTQGRENVKRYKLYTILAKWDTLFKTLVDENSI